MMKSLKKLSLLLLMLASTLQLWAWSGMPMPALHVEGRWLCDEEGNHVNLHGYGQTYSPWFNEQGSKWSNYDVNACLSYNKNLIYTIDRGGWKMQWLRLHMDPYWSNTPGVSTTGENDISAFSEDRFRTYLSSVFVPMVKYAEGKGLYVVMRPPGVCPDKLSVGDAYQQYLIKVWKIVVNHVDLKNNPHVMFELANEPINMNDGNGNYTSYSDGSFKKCTQYFQAIVDTIRAQGADNILWVPGLGYQSQYAGYAKYPITGPNIGYAVHCYPGWYGSDSESDTGSAEQGVVTKGAGYAEFKAGWESQVKPCADIAPILITEMDWAPQKYNKSWGKATTGVAGGVGFGANFKYLMDKTGNVSWMLFTGPELIAKYIDSAKDGQTFLTDPEACVRPIFRWYQEYTNPDWQFQDTLALKAFYFPGTEVDMNPSIWEHGTFENNTLITGQYGFGGWQFGTGIDLSQWKYLVIKLKKAPTTGGWSFRVFDQNSYWTDPAMYAVEGKTQVVVNLQTMKTSNNVKVDPHHIYICGFWSYGGTPLQLDKLYLTNNSDYSEETGVDVPGRAEKLIDVYDLTGRAVLRNVTVSKVYETLHPGIYFIEGKKIRIM